MRPSASTTKPVPSPACLPSRPACLITTTDWRARAVICSTDLPGGEAALCSSSANTIRAKVRSTPSVQFQIGLMERLVFRLCIPGVPRLPTKLRAENAEDAEKMDQPSQPPFLHWRSRGQCRPGKLVRLEFRVDAEVAKHVFANELAVRILQHGAHLEPGFLVDVNRDIGDVVFFRLGAGPPKHVTGAVADFANLADTEIFDMQGPFFLGGFPVTVGFLNCSLQAKFLHGVTARLARILAIHIALNDLDENTGQARRLGQHFPPVFSLDIKRAFRLALSVQPVHEHAIRSEEHT